MKRSTRLLHFLRIASSALLTITCAPAATYYWDSNTTAATFGAAMGTWADPTTGSATQGWTAATNGTTTPDASRSILIGDDVNFGFTGSPSIALTTGSIAVSGTVNVRNISYGSTSGNITLAVGGTINLGATSVITTSNGASTNNIDSVLAGAATSLTKAGNGSLLLTGSNTYAGATIVNAGTLNLGGSTATGSLASTVLTLGGGAFHFTRSDGATESFTTTNINSRFSAISVSATNVLNLGTVTRGTGGTFDFSSTGSGTLAAAVASNTAGIMPGLTFGDSWAVANDPGFPISALGSYTLTSVAGTTGTNYTGNNIDVDNVAGTLDAAIIANSLRFSAAASNTLALATGTNTISTSGILVGSAVGANLSTISGGTLTGAVSKDLSIIQNNVSGGLTISSAIANNTSTSITKSGAGLLTLAGNNTFTGGLNIHAGSVNLGDAGALNSTAGSQNAVNFTAGSTGLALKGNSVVVRSLDASAGSMVVENANVTPATLTIGNSANANSTIAGLIQDGTGGGALGLIKAGNGTLVLSNTSNSYTGGTFINAGSLQPNAAALGTSANTITFTGNGALLPVYGSNPTFTQGIVINPGVTGQLNAVNQFYHHTVSGVVSGSGTLLIAGTDNSNGNVTLSNTGNSHTGIIRVGSTTISGNLYTANIADGVGAGAVQLGGTTGAGNLIFSGTSAPQTFTTRVFTLSGTTGGGRITNNGAPANIVTISQNLAITVNGAKTLTLGGSNTGANTFSGTIGNSGSGATSLTKADAGSWTLSGNNGYTGTTSLSGGTASTLVADNASALGVGGNITYSGNGTLQYTVNSAGTDWSTRFKSSTFAIGIDSGGQNVTFAGIIDSTNSNGFIKYGSGSVTLSNANTFTGTTSIDQGTLVLGANAPVSAAGALGNSNTEVALGTAGSGSFAQLYTNGAFTVDRAIRLRTSDTTDAGTRQLTIGGTTAHDSVFTGNIFLGTTNNTSKGIRLTAAAGGKATFSGVIQNPSGQTGGEITAAAALTAVTKVGVGTVVLSNTNTYTGATAVSAGTLALGANDVLPTTPVTIGAATLDAATFDDTAGTLTVTNAVSTINLGSGANLAFATGSPAWTGTLNLTGTLNFSGGPSSSLRFGTSNAGLTPTQIGLIAAPGWSSFALDADGYLTAVGGGGNTAPTITDIANLSIPSGTNTGALAFTVGDAETAVGSLNVTVSSSNLTLVPNANIVPGGSGASRNVTVTPVSGLVGSATITVTVTDGGLLTAQDTFTLTVTDNYLSWATANGVTGGEGGDHDNDGVKNLVEYALIDGGERGVFSGNTITFTKRGGVYGTDLTYDIESSTGLTAWSVLAKPPVVETSALISYTFTPGSPVKNFARLKVVKTP